MDFTSELIIDQDKKATILGLIDKFLSWIQQTEYTIYKGRTTNDELAALITRITELPREMAISGAHWESCQRRIAEIQYALHTPPAECISEESCYLACHRSLATTLHYCRVYVSNANAQ